ncbi:PD-(D/E)XK nuclease family protein [Marinithermus hydrothermalis]|uniref:PD-(D/E)XK endonuclease-like domain-containing protein n=1 Tax=Marinithermus hydrothermalis (strain DSM 14884 / JCM 11576 / T1) TaxID=869210 RepID=F2NKF9_MARHT|nr:PD-(D/E)XK nuclease family protein [Marinithermus hydrothermalis]AEB12408.1 hypothetical protein Marky_1673 [Marinithermus hydrothermalis DSM 14884]
MQLVVGPPGSGKTARLLKEARAVLEGRGRVWWLALPSQRAYVYRRATREGPLLGLEVLQLQQAYYRLLAAARRLKPLFTASARVARVGEALKELAGRPPTPGEARLFARGIAEAKRYGLTWRAVPEVDAEARRFKAVFRLYEALKDPHWDLDDARLAAVELAGSGRFEPEADLVIADGFRELSPLEVRFLTGLAQRIPVWASLPKAPPGFTPTQTLPARPSRVVAYRAANPVSELRWVLTRIKQDLLEGYAPLDLAVIVPEERARAVQVLAEEYGLYLMDETRAGLAETEAGRVLLDLLEFPDHPTPSRAAHLEGLEPLVTAAFDQGLSGREALGRLAQELGLQQRYAEWMTALEPQGDPLAWAEGLIARFPVLAESPYRAALLDRAREARWLGAGPEFRRWWAALVGEMRVFERPRSGVALLTPEAASGRRFRRAYVMYAVEGAYRAGEREDYFVPEEARLPWARAFEELGLPVRLRGRDAGLWAELRTRADEVILTFPEAEQGGLLEPEAGLVGLAREAVPPLPEVPPASPLLLEPARPRPLPNEAPELPPAERVSVEALRQYATCPFRFWAERRLPLDGHEAGWRALVRALRERGRLGTNALQELAEAFPEAAAWLGAYRERLLELRFGVWLPQRALPRARLDAVRRNGAGEVEIYRFVEPEAHPMTPQDAREKLKARWSELYAAGWILEHGAGGVRAVRLWVWPVGGAPVEAYKKPVRQVWASMRTRAQKAREALDDYRSGRFAPRPGYHCRTCAYADVCRYKEEA